MADGPPAFVYLASHSPRRRALLEQIGLTYELVAVRVDETPLPGETAAAYVSRLALAKARAGWQALPTRRDKDGPVLGADTAVVIDDIILGKPTHRAEGLAMLARLSGREHQVWSAVALVAGKREAVRSQESRVRFRPLTRPKAQRTGLAANRPTRPAPTAFRAGRRRLSPNCTAAILASWACRC